LDTLFGLGDNDTLFALAPGVTGDGDLDMLFGGEGNDFLHLGFDDQAFGEAGDDTISLEHGLLPNRLDGGGGTDTLLLYESLIDETTLVGIERLGVGNGSIGGRLTANQLGQFLVIAPVDFGQTDVRIRLFGGGTANLNPIADLSTFTIHGSVESETLSLAAASMTAFTYLGSDGNALVLGGAAGDHLEGGNGADTLWGRGGNDELFGATEFSPADAAADVLHGGAGSDILHADNGDQAFGDGGNDLLIAASALPPSILDGGLGADTLLLFNGRDISGATLTSLEQLIADNDSIGNRLTASQLGQFNTILPISGQTGVHLRLTGGGTANLNPVASIATLTIDGSAQAESLNLAATSNTALVYFGSEGNASVGGGAAGDHLQGGNGADTLSGRGGDDQLFGNTVSTAGDAAADELVGGNGNDTIHVGFLDRAFGNADDDVLILTSTFAPAILDGGTGNDTLRLDNGDISGATISGLERLELPDDPFSEGRLTASQLNSFSVVAGIGGSDSAFLRLTSGGSAGVITTASTLADLHIVGSNENDGIGLSSDSNTVLHFDGLDGDDNVIGALANDSLRGGSGNDILHGVAGADLLDGGGGSDTASYLLASSGVRINLNLPGQNTGDATGDRLVSIENLIGSTFADELIGNNGGNRLNGGLDADLLFGRGGADRLFGQDGNDTLFGDSGNDLLVGGNGSDELAGDAGADRLRGDAGADLFITAALGGSEAILDFEDGSDHLRFEGFGPRFDTAAEVLARASQVGSDVHIVLPNPTGGSTRMIILNFLIADLDAGDLVI
jgi:Ca2+-binding RTX toxin-like protein